MKKAKKNFKMPVILKGLLGMILPKDERPFLTGNFEELFEDTVREKGRFFAGLWLCGEMIKSFPGIMSVQVYWRLSLIKNYFKMSVRTLLKYKGYSLINISGLTIGMASCLLIFLWVQDECQFDRFHVNAKNLFRVVSKMSVGNRTSYSWKTPPPLVEALKRDIPAVRETCRFFTKRNKLLKVEEKSFYENRFAFADPSFFKMFTFPLVRGNPLQPFSGINSIVISDRLAEKYFGAANPIGKRLNLDNRFDLVVSGVFKAVPHNSHFEFDSVVPFEFIKNYEPDFNTWDYHAFSTYVLTGDNVDLEALNAAISGLKAAYHNKSRNEILFLQPLEKIHLYKISGEKGKILNVYIFSSLAILILLIACINFINLTTARSFSRSKEIALRKVVGARRSNIISQFFGETLLLTIIALILSLQLTNLLLPVFSKLTGKTFAGGLNLGIYLLPWLAGIFFFSGIAAGIYPALFISSFQPALIFRKKALNGSRGSFSRKLLVILQFSFTIFLVISTLTINNQLSFIMNNDIGFERENIIYFPLREEQQRIHQALKNDLSQFPGIINVTSATRPPGFGTSNASNAVDWPGKDPGENVIFCSEYVDYNYIETLGMKMIKGSGFSRERSNPLSNHVLINQEAAKIMGMESPIGKTFSFSDEQYIIEGVVKDFHLWSFRGKIIPMVLILKPDQVRFIMVRTGAGKSNQQAALNFIKKTWKKHAPGFPLVYHFLDDTLDEMYKSEQRTHSVFNYFSFLAIFISSLGLLGLTSFTARKRTREISIRKVLGASTGSIFLMLTREFSSCILLANIFAWPAAYLFINRWLQGFVYKTGMGIENFFISGFLVLIAALLTVSYQSFKAALTNPASVLQCE